jgi:hypothetical protein
MRIKYVHADLGVAHCHICLRVATVYSIFGNDKKVNESIMGMRFSISSATFLVVLFIFDCSVSVRNVLEYG